MNLPKLTRVAAGVYESDDGQHRLLRTEWDGPQGGHLVRWEHAELDRGGWVIDGLVWEWTLREAKAALSHALSTKDTP